ncbi:MAG: archaemetzincin family Zn-dependent metalloprotease [Candidatus Bathyarchaeia archaeon]
MKIGIIRTGKVEQFLVERIRENLQDSFDKADFAVLDGELQVPRAAFDRKRRQYRSDLVLDAVESVALGNKAFSRVLGVVDFDLFAAPLNFVFGQARYVGKAALISMFRLRQEFYGRKEDVELLVERGTKEAVHELGHTFGLEHCVNPFCVMYFSNSIFDTDRKQSLFCSKCQTRLWTSINSLGEEL